MVLELITDPGSPPPDPNRCGWLWAALISGAFFGGLFAWLIFR